MRFAVLLKADRNTEAGALPGEAVLAAMGRYDGELVEAGVLPAGEGLHPSSRGARVHFWGPARPVVDGAFAETRELVAGFRILQVESRDEAIAWVKRGPSPLEGEAEIEIRRVVEAEDFGEAFTPESREQEHRQRAGIAGRA